MRAAANPGCRHEIVFVRRAGQGERPGCALRIGFRRIKQRQIDELARAEFEFTWLFEMACHCPLSDLLTFREVHEIRSHLPPSGGRLTERASEQFRGSSALSRDR